MAVSDAQPTIPSSSELLRAKCGWIIALGVVYLVAGIVALSSVAFATAVTVFLVGVMMIVSGVAEVINAFQLKSWGKFLLWVLLGALYVVAGIVTIENPLLTAKLLTLMLGVFLVASGIAKIILAFSMKAGSSWVVVLAGAISLFVGVEIVAKWPIDSIYILGIFLAVDLIFTGVGWISVGLGLKSRR